MMVSEVHGALLSIHGIPVKLKTNFYKMAKGTACL